jgi:hypothetical protein
MRNSKEEAGSDGWLTSSFFIQQFRSFINIKEKLAHLRQGGKNNAQLAGNTGHDI